MKCFFRIFIFFVLSFLFIAPSYGQGRIYTKKILLADFSTKITKIAIDDKTTEGRTLQDEISARWNISPYEFCSLADMEQYSKDNNYYLIRFINEDGIKFLSVDKGGKDDEKDNLKKALHLIKMPFCSANTIPTFQTSYIGAMVDIIQNYISLALSNESIAYKGLEIFKNRNVRKLRMYFNTDDFSEFFSNNEINTAVGLCVSANDDGEDSYKMLIRCDTHELLLFKKQKISENSDKWTKSEINTYSNKNEIVTR